MNILIKEDQHLRNKYNLLVQTLEQEHLPERVKIKVSEVDTFGYLFGYVFVDATVSAKIMELNIAVDLLHMPVNLLELETAEDIVDKVMDLADTIRHKYGQIFS